MHCYLNKNHNLKEIFLLLNCYPGQNGKGYVDFGACIVLNFEIGIHIFF